MKPKSKGAGIMVSDFINEHNGFLALTDDEYKRAAEVNPSQKQVHVHSSSMVRTVKDTGIGTDLLIR